MSFENTQSVANYSEGPPRLVPGFADMQRMALLLLAERAQQDARVLVVGAGGGLELRVFADAMPGWQFDGIDPSAAMLRLAAARLGPDSSRVRFHEGYVETAPQGPFDAAACLLTLHFLPAESRYRTLQEIHRRLKPGAPFVAVHHSFPQTPDERERWLSRFAAFAVSSGVDPEMISKIRTAPFADLPFLAPEQDEALMRDAGFVGVKQFYAAFTFRGWVAYK